MDEQKNNNELNSHFSLFFFFFSFFVFSNWISSLELVVWILYVHDCLSWGWTLTCACQVREKKRLKYVNIFNFFVHCQRTHESSISYEIKMSNAHISSSYLLLLLLLLLRFEEVSYLVIWCIFSLLSFFVDLLLLFDVFVVFRFDLSALWSTSVCNGYRRWWIDDCSQTLSLLTKERNTRERSIGNDKMYQSKTDFIINQSKHCSVFIFFLLKKIKI